MARELESPSSINLWYQCPRKYFYKYVLNLPSKTSIHLIRGSIVHTCCEKFYDTPLPSYDRTAIMNTMHNRALNLLQKEWDLSEELDTLDLKNNELDQYLEETKAMMRNFTRYVIRRLLENVKNGMTFEQAWQKAHPIVEKEIICKKYGVQGHLDVIHNSKEGRVNILDYKTSAKDEIAADYERQLAIYALIHHVELNILPHRVGILFLKYDQEPVMLNVDDRMINIATSACETIRQETKSDKLKDYRCKESGLCKWKTGQCDYYDRCLNDKCN